MYIYVTYMHKYMKLFELKQPPMISLSLSSHIGVGTIDFILEIQNCRISPGSSLVFASLDFEVRL